MRAISLWRALARLLRPYLLSVSFAAAAGCVGSLATVGLLKLIEEAMRDGLPVSGAVAFLSLCALMVGAEIVSYRTNSRVVQSAMADLRKAISDDILAAPIATLERLQNHRLIVALNHDITELTGFVRSLPFLAVSTLTALGCILYLFYISWRLALIAAVVALIPVFVIGRTLKVAYKYFYVEHEAREQLQKESDTLTAGAKELRLNRTRRQRFRDDRLFARIDEVADVTHRNFTLFVAAESLDIASVFVIIGALFVARPFLGEQPTTLGAFIVALLYLRGHINFIVGYLPVFGRAVSSFRRIVELREELATSETIARDDAPAPKSFERISLRAVCYAYAAKEDAPAFVLGPINLDIIRGETLFIVGENGSGKTTLVKLLLGLYTPTTGEILLDGAPVTDDNRDAFRQLYSAVFFDYCLFDDVAVEASTADAAKDYLARMELSDKTAIVDGVFSTTALSAGQRKRLALVSAFAEGRPIMALDEWAAEQDPTFRRAFYQQILPDLKGRGKTMVCVSHDDRYFSAADRVVHISNGKIVDV